MTRSIRSAPRWLIAMIVCALLAAGIAYGSNGARAQDNSDATSTSTTTDDSTVTAASNDTSFSAGDSVFVSDGPLNLREAAGTSKNVVLKLPTGTPLTIVSGP